MTHLAAYFGWADEFDGRDSTQLLKCCLDASRNGAQMKRDLLPLVNVLANLAKCRIAADLKA